MDFAISRCRAGSRLANKLINYLTEVVAVILAFRWLGWHGAVIIFLTLWAANTVYATKEEE